MTDFTILPYLHDYNIPMMVRRMDNFGEMFWRAETTHEELTRILNLPDGLVMVTGIEIEPDEFKEDTVSDMRANIDTGVFPPKIMEIWRASR